MKHINKVIVNFGLCLFLFISVILENLQDELLTTMLGLACGVLLINGLSWMKVQ